MEGDDLWSTALTGEQGGLAPAIPRRQPAPTQLHTNNNNNYDSNMNKDYYVTDRPRMFTEKKSYEEGQYTYGAAPPPGSEDYYRASPPPSPDRRPAVAHPPPVFPQADIKRKAPLVQSTQELASRKYFSQKRNILNMKKIMKPEALTPTEEAAKKPKMQHFNGKPAEADEWDEEPPDLDDLIESNIHSKVRADGIFHYGSHEDRLLFYNTRPNSSNEQANSNHLPQASEGDPRERAWEDYHKYHYVAKKGKAPGGTHNAKAHRAKGSDDGRRRYQNTHEDDDTRSNSNDGSPPWRRRDSERRRPGSDNGRDQQVPHGERTDRDPGRSHRSDNDYPYREDSRRERQDNSDRDDVRYGDHRPPHYQNESPRKYEDSRERENLSEKPQYPVKRLYPVKGNRLHQAQPAPPKMYDNSDQNDVRGPVVEHVPREPIPVEEESVKSKGSNKEDIMKMLIDAGNKSVMDYRKIKEEGNPTPKTSAAPAASSASMKFIVNYPTGAFSQGSPLPAPGPALVRTSAPPSTIVPQSRPGLIPVARPPPNVVVRQLPPGGLTPGMMAPRVMAPAPASIGGGVPSVQILPAGAAIPAGAVPVQRPHFPIVRGGVIPSAGMIPAGAPHRVVAPPRIAPPGVVPPGLAAAGIVPARVAMPGVAQPIIPMANQMPRMILKPPSPRPQYAQFPAHPMTPRFVTSPTAGQPAVSAQPMTQPPPQGIDASTLKMKAEKLEPELFCDLEVKGS